MTKTATVKSSSASSSDSRETGFFSLFSWSSLYKLCSDIPYYTAIRILDIYVLLGYLSLSVDPDYPWGPTTKKVLIYFHTIFRGVYMREFGSMTTLIIFVSVALAIMLATALGIRYVMRADHPNQSIVHFVQVMLCILTQSLHVLLLSITFEPWKCSFTTGMMMEFPEYKCLGNPNLALFILSFISLSTLTFLCFVKFYL
jgi:hypothetical protein